MGLPGKSAVLTTGVIICSTPQGRFILVEHSGSTLPGPHFAAFQPHHLIAKLTNLLQIIGYNYD
jgi:hypothetical protein